MTHPPAVFAVYEIQTNDLLKESHKAGGGLWIRQFASRIHDGYLRIMFAVEPLPPPRDPLAMHISISFCETLSGKSGPRLATDEECAEVRRQLRRFVNWHGQFVEESEPGKKVRHFWNEKYR